MNPGDLTVDALVRGLDFRLACIRCGQRVSPDEGAVITPWTVGYSDRPSVACVGIYITFLCQSCRAADNSTAADIVALDAGSTPTVTEDSAAFKFSTD